MFLWPEPHSDVKCREQLPWLWNTTKPLFPQVSGEGLYDLFLGLLFWSRPYINFDKYCQQVKAKLIILGASRKYAPKAAATALM